MSENGSQDTRRETSTGEQDGSSPPADESVSIRKATLVPMSGKNDGKNPQDYRFWNTQPVPRLDDLSLSTENAAPASSHPDGAILPITSCQELAKAPPEPLIQGFEWCEINVNEPSELLELQNLLYNHYVEDDDGSFRLNYSIDFLAWALRSPGWTKDWHLGVRTTSKNGKTGKLVAFVAGVPVTLGVRENVVKAVEINFLTIHQKLRGKRLAPVLIKEITRRCYAKGVYQALYTAGTVLPSPVASYWVFTFAAWIYGSAAKYQV
ncbi:hypothetical protein E4T43_01468 [Aureobasidium subglaciale]|nr:hypothetical protein E4T43_01468 [Aureobasidium subglaciale]